MIDQIRKMNSLNILSSRVIGQALTSKPPFKSQDDSSHGDNVEDQFRLKPPSVQDDGRAEKNANDIGSEGIKFEYQFNNDHESTTQVDEKSPLVKRRHDSEVCLYRNRLKNLMKRIADALTALLSTIGAPAIYIVSCFQADDGHYSPIVPFRRLKRTLGRRSKTSTSSAVGLSNAPEGHGETRLAKGIAVDSSLRHPYSSESLTSTTSGSDSGKRRTQHGAVSPKARLSIVTSADASTHTRRSIRIKLNNEGRPKRRKRREATAPSVSEASAPLTVDNIKSPISPSPSLKATHYPHPPQPPRPLVPRRQPSY